jgi:hypothetical protein
MGGRVRGALVKTAVVRYNISHSQKIGQRWPICFFPGSGDFYG